MNFLQLTHLLPWPPVDGGKKGILGFVEGYRRHPAVERHSLISMCPQSQFHWAQEWKPEGEQPQFDVFDTRNRILPFLQNTAFSTQPYNMAKYQRPSFARLVEAAIARRVPDVVHLDGAHTSYYAPLVRRLAPDALRILRCHNAEHVILERLANTEKNPLKRALLGIQARRLKRYEAAALDNFDLILAITDVDAERFRAMNPRSEERMIVIPAGADIPSELPPLPRKGAGPLRIVHIAAMDWLPNQAGLRWLVNQVLPLLEAAGLDYHLDAVGKNMPDEFLRMNNPRVTVHGFVQDLRPITSAAHLAVVPLHVGGGMRVKILDYWSMGIPVVATRVGAEGLTDGGAIALADEPGDFAAAIRRLADDDAELERLRQTGFSKVAASYGWPALVDKVITQVEKLRSRRITEADAQRALSPASALSTNV